MEKSQGETKIVSTKTEFNISSTEDVVQENLPSDRDTERNLNSIPIQTAEHFETKINDSQEQVGVTSSQINTEDIEDGQDVMKKPSSEELASSAKVIGESDIPDNASVNEGLLKAVTTQLIQDYPDLVSNLTYLQALAVNQTLLLQSFINSGNEDTSSQPVNTIYPGQKPPQTDQPTINPSQQPVTANQSTINQDQQTINPKQQPANQATINQGQSTNPSQQPLHINQPKSQQPVNQPTINQSQQLVQQGQQPVQANQSTINQGQQLVQQVQPPVKTNQPTLYPSQQPVPADQPTTIPSQQPIAANHSTRNQDQQPVPAKRSTRNQDQQPLYTNEEQNPNMQVLPQSKPDSRKARETRPVPAKRSTRNQDQQPLHTNEEQNPNMQALPQSKPDSRKAGETRPPFAQDLVTQPDVHIKASHPLCNSDQNVNTVPEPKSEILGPTSKPPVNLLQDPNQPPAQQYSSVLQTPHYSTSHQSSIQKTTSPTTNTQLSNSMLPTHQKASSLQSSPQQSITPPKPAFFLPCPNHFSGLPTPEKPYLLSPTCLLPTPQQPGYISPNVLQNAFYSPRLNNPSMISAGLRQPQMTTLPDASYQCPSPRQVTSNTGIRFPVRAPLSSSDTNIGTSLHLQYPMKAVRSIRLQAPQQTGESPTKTSPSVLMSKMDSINVDSETVGNHEISRKTSDGTTEKANKPKPLMSLHCDSVLLEHPSNIEFSNTSSVFGSPSSVASLDNGYNSGNKGNPATRSKRRKCNKTLLSDNENKLFPGVSQTLDAWDQEVDPYPETFKFNVDLKRPLNFGENSSGLSDVTRDTQASQLLSNKVKQPTKRVPSEKKMSEEKNQRPEQSKLNTEFLGRSETKQELKYEEEPVDEWQTVPISKKNKKSKQDSPKAPTATTSKKIPGLHSKNDGQSTFENLVRILSVRIPNVTRPDILYVFSEIRKKRGTLKGMPLQDIVKEGRSILDRKTEKESLSGVVNAYNNGGQKSALPPRFKRLLKKNSSELPVVSVNEEGELCVICCDELIMEKTKILDCGHEFHSMCISEWVYKHERTCPTCRQIALFPEEFPHLQKSSHK
ncbi:protein piccolo-like isoform X2 [Patella vulgata]|uniref:protein piccolo-like isoform X2 n=1 Tax=Patella vulgata TaxID=6465 RepID=UPI0024A9941B|nr:protein piccolo-like isoform X2 [Patella vulgata]